MEIDLKKTVQKNLIPLSLVFILIVIVLNSLFIFRQRHLIMKHNVISNDILIINSGLDNIHENVQLADVGVRAFLLKQEERFLDPYNVSLANYEEDLLELEKMLKKYNYPVEKMKPAKRAVTNYIQTVEQMVNLTKAGAIEEAIAIFDKDIGKDTWMVYSSFVNDASDFVAGLQAKTDKVYASFIRTSLLIQLLLLSFSIPVIIITLAHILKNRRERRELIKNLDDSNNNFVFNSGEETETEDDKIIIQKLISNLRQAAEFIQNLSKGNFSVTWNGMTEKNKNLNQTSISGELINMRDKLKAMKEEDENRLWFTEGMSKFSDLIRENQKSLEELCNTFISGLTRYTNSNQGTILIAPDEPTEINHLEVKGMYAYDRERFVNKNVNIQNGLAGQSYLERETIYLTNIPSNYIYITSGLGEATPEALLLVPIKNESEIVGVVELASFHPFEQHVVKFVEELSSNLASAIISTRNSENTRNLLMKSQQQTEELKATEEEIRQNMEELQATQEQLSRKNDEMNKLLDQYAENEEMMHAQLEELEGMKKDEDELVENLESYRSMMLDILNELPVKVFLKDEEGKIFLANTKVAETHNMEIEELIGKSDFDFVDRETANLWRKDELEIIKKGQETYVFEEDFGHGKRIMETTKKRFYIRPIKQIGLLGIQTDITNNANASQKLKEFTSRNLRFK